MSETESFGQVMAEMADKVASPYWIGMAERLKRAYDRAIRDTAQREFARGVDAGKHSMDAEHRAVAMRLRQLPLDGGSHENLSQIARAVYHSDFGWTKGACAALRDKLIDLMGGVSDDIYKNGDSCETGDGDDTCDSQCCGACADCDGRDSWEQTEVTYERAADDCGAAVRCGDGGGAVHMAGVTYDVLDNERRKAVLELREIPNQMTGDELNGPYHEFYIALATAIGIDANETLFSKVRDRLIHLLGGERPSGIDVMGEMDEREIEGGITDELRKWASDRHCKGMSHTDVLNIGLIADRIDEQEHRLRKHRDGFERQHQKAVNRLGVLRRERDNLLDLLRDARDEYNTLDQMSAETSANFHAMRDRVWGLEAERDELRTELEELRGHLRTCPESCDEASEIAPSVSITDELREFVGTFSKRLSISVAEVNAIADRIDEQFDRICQQHEAVLQSTIDGMVDDRDHWKQVAETNANALLKMGGENASLKADCKKLEKLRDHWHQQVTDMMNHADAIEHERDAAYARTDELSDELLRVRRERDELRAKIAIIRETIDG